jgi:hypothetical protein
MNFTQELSGSSYPYPRITGEGEVDEEELKGKYITFFYGLREEAISLVFDDLKAPMPLEDYSDADGRDATNASANIKSLKSANGSAPTWGFLLQIREDDDDERKASLVNTYIHIGGLSECHVSQELFRTAIELYSNSTTKLTAQEKSTVRALGFIGPLFKKRLSNRKSSLKITTSTQLLRYEALMTKSNASRLTLAPIIEKYNTCLTIISGYLADFKTLPKNAKKKDDVLSSYKSKITEQTELADELHESYKIQVVDFLRIRYELQMALKKRDVHPLF